MFIGQIIDWLIALFLTNKYYEKEKETNYVTKSSIESRQSIEN